MLEGGCHERVGVARRRRDRHHRRLRSNRDREKGRGRRLPSASCVRERRCDALVSPDGACQNCWQWVRACEEGGDGVADIETLERAGAGGGGEKGERAMGRDGQGQGARRAAAAYSRLRGLPQGRAGAASESRCRPAAEPYRGRGPTSTRASRSCPPERTARAPAPLLMTRRRRPRRPAPPAVPGKRSHWGDCGGRRRAGSRVRATRGGGVGWGGSTPRG